MSKITSILQREDRFLVVTHISPDGDAIGSLLGMFLALTSRGKTCHPMLDDNIPELYHFLPGIESIITSPEQMTYEPKWIICLDVAAKNRISGDIDVFLGKAQLINIDHHPTNPMFGDLNWVNTEAASTAELVYEVLTQNGDIVSSDAAKCLYTGLVADTGCFRFGSVNRHTFQIAARLLDTGFQSYDVTRRLYEEFPLRRFHLEKLVLDRMEILLDGRLSLSSLYQNDFASLGAEPSDSENFVTRLRQIQGVEVSVLITELSNELTKASFRSKGRLDVAAIAATLGGGGHHRASGLRSTLPPEALKEKIIAAIEASL